MLSHEVLRYTSDEVKSVIAAKAKPEPWLHAVIVTNEAGDSFYAIYAWDSRQVIEEGKSRVAAQNLREKQYREGAKALSFAIDNGKRLKNAKLLETNAVFDERAFVFDDKKQLLRVYPTLNAARRPVKPLPGASHVIGAKIVAREQPDLYMQHLK